MFLQLRITQIKLWLILDVEKLLHSLSAQAVVENPWSYLFCVYIVYISLSELFIIIYYSFKNSHTFLKIF